MTGVIQYTLDQEQYYSDEEMPELISQYTVKDNIEVWEIEVLSVNSFTARQRARAYARRLDPTIKNFLTPSAEEKEQATFDQLFPNTIGREEYRVELTVVR